jgi:flagellar motor component MotA
MAEKILGLIALATFMALFASMFAYVLGLSVSAAFIGTFVGTIAGFYVVAVLDKYVLSKYF